MDFKKHLITSTKGLMDGNFIYNKQGEVYAYAARDYKYFNQPQMGGDYGLYAIELTDEWLLKFGWSYRNENRGLGAILDREDTGMSIALLEGGYKLLLVAKSHRITTVHYLQNLYYFVTGIELIISE